MDPKALMAQQLQQLGIDCPEAAVTVVPQESPPNNTTLAGILADLTQQVASIDVEEDDDDDGEDDGLFIHEDYEDDGEDSEDDGEGVFSAEETVDKQLAAVQAKYKGYLKSHVGYQEEHAMTVDKAKSIKPSAPKKTDKEFVFIFQAPPQEVRVHAKSAVSAKERALSVFDPLGVTWEVQE